MLGQLLANGLISGALYAILAVSFAFIYNTTRILHIAHGAVYVAGAYVCYFFVREVGLSIWSAVGLAVGASVLLGAIMELLIYAPLSRRGGSTLVALLSSLGLYVALVNTIALVFGNETKVIRPGADQTYDLGALTFTRIQLAHVLIAAVLLPGLLLLVRHATCGKLIRAVRDDATLASVLGINVRAVRVGVFCLGSGLAGLAGVLASLDVGMDPHVGMPALLAAAVGMIVGGVGTFEGPVLGGLLLGLLHSLAVWVLSAQWTDALTFMVLILVLLFRPYGIMGRRMRVEEGAE